MDAHCPKQVSMKFNVFSSASDWQSVGKCLKIIIKSAGASHCLHCGYCLCPSSVWRIQWHPTLICILSTYYSIKISVLVFLLDLSWIIENFCICSGNSSSTHLFSESAHHQQVSSCTCPLPQKSFLCLVKPHFHFHNFQLCLRCYSWSLLLLCDKYVTSFPPSSVRWTLDRSLQSPGPQTPCSRTHKTPNPF